MRKLVLDTMSALGDVERHLDSSTHEKVSGLFNVEASVFKDQAGRTCDVAKVRNYDQDVCMVMPRKDGFVDVSDINGSYVVEGIDAEDKFTFGRAIAAVVSNKNGVEPVVASEVKTDNILPLRLA